MLLPHFNSDAKFSSNILHQIYQYVKYTDIDKDCIKVTIEKVFTYPDSSMYN